MSVSAEIKRAIREVVGDMTNLPIVAEVVSVEGDSCTVKIPSGLEVSGIRLKATINGSDDFIMKTPAEGSNVVLMSLTGSIDNSVIAIYDKVEKIEISQSGLNVVVDSADGKISVFNDSSSMIDVMQKMADTIKQLKVPTPSGLSGTPFPDTIASVQEFETGFKSLLK